MHKCILVKESMLHKTSHQLFLIYIGMVMGPDCYDTIELQSSQDDIWLSFEAQCGRNEPSMNDDCRKKSIYSPRWKRRKLSFEILDDILQMNSFKSGNGTINYKSNSHSCDV